MTQIEIIKFIKSLSSEFTLLQILEISQKLPFAKYLNPEEYIYAGHWVLTKDSSKFEEDVSNMCCGIVKETIVLRDKTPVFFAFDYGH